MDQKNHFIPVTYEITNRPKSWRFNINVMSSDLSFFFLWPVTGSRVFLKNVNIIEEVRRLNLVPRNSCNWHTSQHFRVLVCSIKISFLSTNGPVCGFTSHFQLSAVMYNHPWPPVSAYRMQHVVPNTQGPEHFGPPALCFLVPSPFGFGPPMRPYQVHPNQRTQRVAHPSLIQSPSSSEATRSDSAIPSSYDSRILDLWNSWLADTKPQMLARRQKMRQTEPSLPKIRARFLRWKELIEILRSEQSSACGSNNSVLEVFILLYIVSFVEDELPSMCLFSVLLYQFVQNLDLQVAIGLLENFELSVVGCKTCLLCSWIHWETWLRTADTVSFIFRFFNKVSIYWLECLLSS